VVRNITFIDEPSVTNDVRLKYMPFDVKSSWDPARDFRFKNRTSEDVALGKKVYQKELKVVGAMQRAGVGILAGTDALNPYCFPGFSLHDELGLLVQAGLTPMQALQAATLNAARFMGREKDLGTIESGKLADLVLLDANPLADIGNTRKINAVVFDGRLYSRSALDEMLVRVETLASRMSIAEVLLKTIEERGAEAAVKQYHELRAAQPEAYDFREKQLNNLGYQLIGMKRIKDAIVILKLNAEAYPQSSNVYDSLGEACLDNGDTTLAIENYEKSLQLDPKNLGAIEKLKQLKVR
jgi:tetratricopeptide (TPR) repeat protein